MSSTTHWDEFWQQGFITTFGGSLPDNYEGSVKSFWHKQFELLPDHAKLLDLATGNGAIATLALVFSKAHHKYFEIDACDSATFSHSTGDRTVIHFHGETPCESLPFANHSFDLLTSQFGIEYSDLPTALAEARRVLKGGGHLCAITHNSHSSLIKESIVELAVYEQALVQVDIFGLVEKYLKLQNRQGRKALKKKLATEINRSINQLISDNRQHIAAREIVSCLTELIKASSSAGADKTVTQLTTAARNFAAARLRLKDMIEAALAQEDIEELKTTARDRGFFTTEANEFCGDGGDIIGWTLRFS